MTVRPDGSVARIGSPIVDELTGLAVSPDGRRAAGVAVRCPNTRVLGLDVVDLRTGRITGVWELPTGNTAISGLSWAPDSRRLAYTLGRGVGGQGSGYALLDTSKPGGQLEQVSAATREFAQGGRTCPVLRSVWLGRTGRFAVFAACVDRNELLLVQQRPDPHAAQEGRVLATLPNSALTLELDAVVTDDGRHLLVTTDVATYRIDGSHVTRLADARPSPAW
jgi:Tol biopolymer transport system component